MSSSLIGGYVYSGIDKPGKYPYINVEQTESGHFIMMDDTPGNETVRIQHGKVIKCRDSNGELIELQTYWKVGPDGSVDQVTAGNNFSVIINNNNVTIGGVCQVTIKADAKISVHGDAYAEIGGNIRALVPNGSVNLVAGGEVDIVASQGVNISAGNATSLNPLTAPDINLITGGTVNITGDLQVSGSITGGASINATTNVTAAMKVLATGGIETLGGINVGFSLPGPILPTGVLSVASMTYSPIVFGELSVFGIAGAGLVLDAQGAMAILRALYNVHSNDGLGNDVPDAGSGGIPDVPGAPPMA